MKCSTPLQKKTNCINKLAVGCCLLNQCKCKEYEKRSKSKNTNGS